MRGWLIPGGLILVLSLVACEEKAVFDSYGGYTGISQDSTGYFTLDKVDDRYYLFTPEGNAFVALGINHFHTTKNTDYQGMIDSIKNWGFNSGCYQGPKWMWQGIPYTKGVNLLESRSYLSEDQFSFEDVFAPEYLHRIEARIRWIVESQAENKMLIGYFLTDMPVWTGKKNGQGWIDFYEALPPESEGAKRYKGWKEEHPESAEEEFIVEIAKQVYSHGIGLIRNYDSNHLVFSDRYNERDISEQVISEILPYVDAIATQPSSEIHPDYFEYLYATFGLPVFVADHVSSFATKEFPVSMGQVARNESDYFDFYSESMASVLSLPYVIGFNKCQYEDHPQPTLLKQGLTRENGVPYDYVYRLREVHEKALNKAYGISSK